MEMVWLKVEERYMKTLPINIYLSMEIWGLKTLEPGETS